MVLKRPFNIGDKIAVAAEEGWPASTEGIVSGGPDIVQTRRGEEYGYWVRFDPPVRDSDGDGPYKAAHVLGRYMTLIRAGYAEVADPGFEARTWAWLVEQNRV